MSNKSWRCDFLSRPRPRQRLFLFRKRLDSRDYVTGAGQVAVCWHGIATRLTWCFAHRTCGSWMWLNKVLSFSLCQRENTIEKSAWTCYVVTPATRRHKLFSVVTLNKQWKMTVREMKMRQLSLNKNTQRHFTRRRSIKRIENFCICFNNKNI